MKKIISLLNGNGKKVEGDTINHKILTLPYITERLLYKTNENYHIKMEMFLIPRNGVPELMLYSNIRLCGCNTNMSIGIVFEEPECDDETFNCEEYFLLRLNDISLKKFTEHINQYICKDVDMSKINEILNYKYRIKKNKILQKNNIRRDWWALLLRYDNEKYNTLKRQINVIYRHINSFTNRIIAKLMNCCEEKSVFG